jgi:hypothetical protein
VNDYNFGLIQIVPTGGTPVVSAALHHAGSSSAVGAKVSLGV